MAIYDIRKEKSGDYYRYFSQQFPTINGFGLTENEALLDFLHKQYDELDRIIRKNERFPKPLTNAESKRRRESGEGAQAMGSDASTTLTMYLHTAMLEKGVSRGELANMLALGEEVEDDGWELEKIRRLKPNKPPQHKKVQRLLDVRHHSTIREIHEAFRVMDYSLDFMVYPKGSFEPEPTLLIG